MILPVWNLVSSDQRGQAMVEFALSISMFMLIVLGLIEGGRLAFSVGTVQHAVYEGSRIAALPSTTTETRVKEVVEQAASGIGLAQANVSATVNGGPYTSTRTKGATIVVSASYTYVPFALAIIPSAMTITRQAMTQAE